MKISSVISVNPNSEKLVQKSPSFRGLWGDTVVKETSDCYSDGAQMIDFYTYDTNIDRIYFPFVDEKDEEINAIKEAYTKTSRAYDSDMPTDNIQHQWYCSYTYNTVEKVSIQKKLVFTAKEFLNYIGGVLDSATATRIENNLKFHKLDKYIRKIVK